MGRTVRIIVVVVGCAAAAAAMVDRQRRGAELRALRLQIRDLQAAQQPSDEADALRRRVEASEGAYRACVAAAGWDAPRPDVGANTASTPKRTGPPTASPEGDSALKRATRTFEGEGVDPAWGRAHTEALRSEALSSLDVDSHLVNVECRTSFCRMDLTHPSVAASNAFIAKMFIGPEATEKASFIASAPELTSEGTRRVALLVSRAEAPPAEK